VTIRPNPTLFDESQREKLAQILREPILVLAIDVAIRSAQPDCHNLAKISPEHQASIANQLAGMTELVRRLDQIAQPTTVADLPDSPADLGEWDHEETETDNPTS